MITKIKLIYLVSIFLLSFLYTNNFSLASDPIFQKIFKIQTYEKNDLGQNYKPYSYGSAVLIEKNKIITNAHVIMGSNGEPSGYYEICKTISFRDKPKCFSTLTLISYSEDNDLAILEINNFGNLGNPVSKSSKEMNIGDSVKIYGYPANGGETITFTEGKISGYTIGFYKVDANMDAGNSGGGAFDSNGELLGISAAVSVGYTTLGLVIPMDKVNDLLSKKGNIKFSDKKENKEFEAYIKNHETTLNNKNTIKDKQFTLSNIGKYGFEIENIRTTLNGDLATYILKTKDTTKNTLLLIQTSRGFGETMTDKLQKFSLDDIKEQMEEKNLKMRTKEFNFKGRTADIAAIYSKDKTDTEIMLVLAIDNISYIIIGDKKELGTLKQALYLFFRDLDIKDDIKSPIINNLELGGFSANLDSLYIHQSLNIYDIETNFVPIGDSFSEGSISYEYVDKSVYVDNYSMLEYLTYYVDVIDIYDENIKDVEYAELKKNDNGVYYGYIESMVEDSAKRNISCIFFEGKGEKLVIYKLSIDIENKDKSIRTILENFINSITIEGESPFSKLGDLGEIDIEASYFDYDFEEEEETENSNLEK